MKKGMISIKVNNTLIVKDEFHLYKIANLVYFFMYVSGDGENIMVMPVGFPRISNRWCEPIKAKMINQKVYIEKSDLKLMNYNIKFYKTIKISEYIKEV